MGVQDFSSVTRVYTRVTFRTYCPDVPVDGSVYVCGEDPELGGWDLSKAVKMLESDKLPGGWTSIQEIWLQIKKPVEYNYVVKDSRNGTVRWLRRVNLKISPTGLEMVQEDDSGILRLHTTGTQQEVLLDTTDDVTVDPHETVKQEALNRLSRLKGEGADKKKPPTVYVVSHCLPLSVHYEADTPLLIPLPEESDAMVNSLYRLRADLAKEYRLLFVGAPRIFADDPHFLPNLTDSQKANLSTLLLEQDCIPVFLSSDLWQKFQNFCYVYLWPITHNFSIFMPQSATSMGKRVKDFQLEDWRAFKTANECYAEAIMKHIRDRNDTNVFQNAGGYANSGGYSGGRAYNMSGGGYNVPGVYSGSGYNVSANSSSNNANVDPHTNIVWAQDWQLLMLARYVHNHSFTLQRMSKPPPASWGTSNDGLQRLGPTQIKCGIYVHVPWPSSDLLKCLPVRTELLRGMLMFDLIGFQIFDYARHFLTACTRLLGVQHTFKIGGFLTLEYNRKSIQLTSKHLCLPADYAKKAASTAGGTTVVIGKADSRNFSEYDQDFGIDTLSAFQRNPASKERSKKITLEKKELEGKVDTSDGKVGGTNIVSSPTTLGMRPTALNPKNKKTGKTSPVKDNDTSSADAKSSGGNYVSAQSSASTQDESATSSTLQSRGVPPVGGNNTLHPSSGSTTSGIVVPSAADLSSRETSRTSINVAEQFPNTFKRIINGAVSMVVTGGQVTQKSDLHDALPSDYKDKIIFGSIDCIERFAGLTNKIQAFRFFLENYPQHHQKFMLLQYLYYPPSVTFDDTDKLQEEIRSMADQINQKYGYHIHLQIGRINDSLSYSVLATSQIFLDTCTKNGLNIAALQFILIHGSEKKTACVILSEFSGASRALIGALRVNPWSTPNICQQLDLSINMLTTERYERFQQDYNYVSTLSLSSWLSDFLTELCFEPNESDSLPVPAKFGASYQELLMQSWSSLLDTHAVTEAYKISRNRLLVFDLDGTLIRLTSSHTGNISTGSVSSTTNIGHPANSSSGGTSGGELRELSTGMGWEPHDLLVTSLQQLCADPLNTVLITSGRSRQQLETWFAAIKGLHILAEDGYWYGPADSERMNSGQRMNWNCIDPLLLSQETEGWRRIARGLMHTFAKRTQGAVVEENSSCIFWHFSGCEPMFGRQQANNLVKQLEELLETKAEVTVKTNKYGGLSGISTTSVYDKTANNTAPNTLAQVPVTIESGNTYVQVRLKGVSKGAALTKFFLNFGRISDGGGSSVDKGGVSCSSTTPASVSATTAGTCSRDPGSCAAGPSSAVDTSKTTVSYVNHHASSSAHASVNTSSGTGPSPGGHSGAGSGGPSGDGLSTGGPSGGSRENSKTLLFRMRQSNLPYSFCLCIGNDRSDEDMFAACRRYYDILDAILHDAPQSPIEASNRTEEQNHGARNTASKQNYQSNYQSHNAGHESLDSRRSPSSDSRSHSIRSVGGPDERPHQQMQNAQTVGALGETVKPFTEASSNTIGGISTVEHQPRGGKLNHAGHFQGQRPKLNYYHGVTREEVFGIERRAGRSKQRDGIRDISKDGDISKDSLKDGNRAENRDGSASKDRANNSSRDGLSSSKDRHTNSASSAANDTDRRMGTTSPANERLNTNERVANTHSTVPISTSTMSIEERVFELKGLLKDFKSTPCNLFSATVGRKPSSAHHYVSDTAALHDLLDRLGSLKSKPIDKQKPILNKIKSVPNFGAYERRV